MGFINSTVIDYPIEEVFKIFIRTAKRDFPKFNEKDPIGCAVTKKVGTYSAKSGTLRIEITDFKLNEVYEITSVKDKMMYVSTYNFEKDGDNRTRIILKETEETPGAFQWVNVILQKIAFKGTVKRRFSVFIDALEKAIEDYRAKVAKSSPKEVEAEEEKELQALRDAENKDNEEKLSLEKDSLEEVSVEKEDK